MEKVIAVQIYQLCVSYSTMTQQNSLRIRYFRQREYWTFSTSWLCVRKGDGIMAADGEDGVE